MQIKSCHFSQSSKVFLLSINSKFPLQYPWPHLVLLQNTFLTSFSAPLCLPYSPASTLTFVLFLKYNNHTLLPDALYLLFTWHRIITPETSHDLRPGLRSDVISSEMAFLIPHAHSASSLSVTWPCFCFFLLALTTTWHIYLFVQFVVYISPWVRKLHKEVILFYSLL